MQQLSCPSCHQSKPRFNRFREPRRHCICGRYAAFGEALCRTCSGIAFDTSAREFSFKPNIDREFNRMMQQTISHNLRLPKRKPKEVLEGTYGSSFGDISISTLDGRVISVSFGANGGDEVLRLLGRDIEIGDGEPPSYVAYGVIGAIEGEGYNPPIELIGTAFQKQVWSELRKVSWRQTITYKELATRIGKPEAYRAVANAVGANRLAVIVPCHRVIPVRGGVGGYRWGSELKVKLLERERQI